MDYPWVFSFMVKKKIVAPKTGNVRMLRLTERQYNNIYFVTGELDRQEKIVGRNCHIML